MAKRFDALGADHIAFIEAQHMFFTGSAAATGRVNISPKGMDTLRVLGQNRIAFLNLTGSGNETAGHLREDPRLTLMWCGFEKRPLILRCYGSARMIQHSDPDWSAMLELFPDLPGARQICDVKIDMVQSSCGYAVPFMDYAGERDTLRHWAEDKGYDGLRAYWAEKNAETLDGRPTGIEADAT
ncbi:pyridoxamine 5'-phosphate oxidase family protein [Salipiger bermudensis]|uniref:pyridoxamine 5'-phosphate oxidase family protein n=1 Tax=Salipiger bermudensis TaxID=344736 RepID=UPI001C99885F|nr:pyridoxamine 5'-phosphate oxidase family protein [Salipiger bermudensis]MBY6005664.1 pyridoxamine 5'-phosphate oxidase family protein [Salipiger bermudensis]